MIPALFLSHGSPMIFLDQTPAHDFLVHLSEITGRPKAIVVISAHWETQGFQVMGTEHPATIYDFGGFDPRLYQLTYPAAGNPALAERIVACLSGHQIAASLNTTRGLDHGAWIPLLLAFPQADIPVLQIAVPKVATPRMMFDLGRALARLREENILIIGSGSFTHNLYEFTGQDVAAVPEPWVVAFADWMREKLAAGDVESLLDYRRLAPFARENHPTEEHILPLFAALGAGVGMDGDLRDETAIALLHHSYNHAILAMDAYGFGAMRDDR